MQWQIFRKKRDDYSAIAEIKKGVYYFCNPPLLLTLSFYFAIIYCLLFDLTLPFSHIVRTERKIKKKTVLFYQSNGTA